MKREDKEQGKGPGCPYCKSNDMKDGKCPDCGAWTDSYGILHRAKCPGGFHDECPVKGK